MSQFRTKVVLLPFRPANLAAIQKLIRELWMIKDGLAKHQVRSYREHYRESRKVVDDTSIPTQKVADILRLCEEVNNAISFSLTEACDKIRARYEPGPPPQQIQDQSIRQAIAFAVQMCYFVPLINQHELRRGPQSIKDLIQKIIKACTSAGPAQELPDDFCEKNLARRTTIKIRYTSDLTQHLQLSSNKLYVFRHGTALKEYARDNRMCDIYPSGFLAETQATIDLLFPVIKTRQMRRKKRLSEKNSADLEVGYFETDDGQPHRLLSKYEYWGQRLAAINDEYETSKPGRLTQWYYDRRDGSSFTTFWFTLLAFLLAVIFGIISTITGIMQTWKAYHSLLDLDTTPELHPAILYGGRLETWGGKYRALKDEYIDTAARVLGSAYLVSSQEYEGALRYYETDMHEVVRCVFTMNAEDGTDLLQLRIFRPRPDGHLCELSIVLGHEQIFGPLTLCTTSRTSSNPASIIHCLCR